MNRRGFLRSNEGVFPLSPKITIIGREHCDFTIQNITVDAQQAVIEYVDQEDCFVLKDLNSTHGSYVNDCRIQNASVRLGDGDVLKFGFSTGQYEFHTENVDVEESELMNIMSSNLANMLPSQRVPWQQNPNSIPQQTTASQPVSLPVINYNVSQPIQHRHTVNGGGMVSWTQLPKAPSSLRSGRPMSASSLNRRQTTPTAPPAIHSPAYSRRGSISGPSKQFLPETRLQLNDDQKILQLQMEVDRLKPLEIDILEKSRQVENLVQQNNELLSSLNESQNYEIYRQIQNLTTEVANKNSEIDNLRNLVGKMTENSNRQNSNMSNNESESNQTRQELEKLRKELKISYGLVTSLQKDLGNRDETINKCTRENQNLTHELTEKNISISALMSKLSRLKDVQEEEIEKQDRERELIGLRHKLEKAETTVQEQAEKLEPLSRNLEKYQQSDKINSEALRDLNKQLDESKTLISDLQRSESLLRVDAQEAEKKYDRFRSKILQVALSTPGFKSSDQSVKDDELVEIMKELSKSKVEHDRRICEKQKLIDEANKKYQLLLDDITHFKNKFSECYDILNSGERTSCRINEIVALAKAFIVHDELVSSREVHIKHLINEMEFLSNLESCISDAGPELANLSLSDCFKRIIQRSIDAVESKAMAENRLAQTMESYEDRLERLKQTHKDEFEYQSQQLVEREKTECEKKFQETIDRLMNEEEIKRQNLIQEFEDKIQQYEENLENLKERITEKDRQFQDYSENLDNKMKKCDELEKLVDDLKKELADVIAAKTTLELSLCEQIDTVNEKWSAEIDLYKEETSQHAITIDLLNDRLIKLNKDNIELKNQLTKSKSEMKKARVSNPASSRLPNKEDSRKEDSQIMQNPYDINESNNNYATIANLEKCISALRHENVLFKNKITEYEGAMTGLNMDLAGAEARLSDLKGELSESQKNEIDTLKMEIQKLETECTNLRVQLSKMAGIVDRLTQDINDKKLENSNLIQYLTESKALVLDKEVRIQELEAQLKHDQESFIQNINQIEQEGRISNELAALGAQCRGERHSQIIDAQKTALSEMRQKMRSLEITQVPKELGGMFSKLFHSYESGEELDSNPSTPRIRKNKKKTSEINIDIDKDDIFPKVLKNSTVPEITQQMLVMKKELAELRSKKALRDGAPKGMNSLTEILALKEKTKKADLVVADEKPKSKAETDRMDLLELRKYQAKLQFDLDFERSKHMDLQKSLDLAELTYLTLLKEVSDVLDIENIKGLKTFDNLSFEAKDILKLDREDSCGLIVQKIRILKERIQRKEELLQSYEQDLVRLKQAEDLAVKTQSQMENIFQQMRYKGEEVELLRETLNRTKDLLNQEKRTNTAIKQNKRYVPEKSSGDTTQVPRSPKIHCPVEDIFGKDKLNEKSKVEKNKRKDYEIKSLKEELYRKEKELSHATNRLYTLETSMGIKSEEPVS